MELLHTVLAFAIYTKVIVLLYYAIKYLNFMQMKGSAAVASSARRARNK